MPQWLVNAVRVVLAIALAGSVFVQTVMLILVWIDVDPMPLAWRLAFISVLFLGIVCLQVIGVNVWKLVSMVRAGTVFSPKAFRHVNWIIGAIIAGAVLIFVIACLGAPGEDVPPGVILLICGASFVTGGVALVVYLMRKLLEQAVETTQRAEVLQSELDEVI